MRGKEAKFNQDLSELKSRAHFSLMKCQDRWGQYLCLFSNDHYYKRSQTYNIYQFPALLRVLGRKADLFTTSLQQELYRKDDGLVAILKWQGLEREFIYIRFNEVNEDFIVEFLAKNKETLIDYMAKQYIELKKGDLDCL